MNLNVIQLIGHVGKNPEIYTSKSGSEYCFFTLATSKRAKDGTTVTQWHPIQAWDKLKDVIMKGVKKGSLIYIEGEMKYRLVDNNGQKYSLPNITAYKLLFLEPKNKKQNSEEEEEVNGNVISERDRFINDEIPF